MSDWIRTDWKTTLGGTEQEQDDYNRWRWSPLNFNCSQYRTPWEAWSYGGFGRSFGVEIQTDETSKWSRYELWFRLLRSVEDRWAWLMLDCECDWTPRSQAVLNLLRQEHPDVTFIRDGLSIERAGPKEWFAHYDAIVVYHSVGYPGRMGENFAAFIAMAEYYGKPLLAMPQPYDSHANELTDPEEYRRAIEISQYARFGIGMWQAIKVREKRSTDAGRAIIKAWKAAEPCLVSKVIGRKPLFVARELEQDVPAEHLAALCRVVWHAGWLPVVSDADDALKWEQLALPNGYAEELATYESRLNAHAGPTNRDAVRKHEENIQLP